MKRSDNEIMEVTQQAEKVNFILPRTEEAINSIISEVSNFFDRIRILLSAVYLVYLGLRSAFFSLNRILDIVYISIYSAQFVFLILEIFRKIRVPIAPKILRFVKLLPTLGMFVLVCIDVFSDLSRLNPWQVILTVFMGIGWILLLLGDLFAEFVPKYAERILSSFKKDIEVKDLLSRSIGQIKDTAKDAIKSENGKKALKTGGAMITLAVLGKGIKTLLNGRNKI